MTKDNRTRLGRTDLVVSPLCLGANRFGAQLDQDASFAILDTLVELGGNFVDTAGAYADWFDWTERSCSEKTIGRWRKARNFPETLIATKGGHPRNGSPARLDRATLTADANASRDNLEAESIDLYYVHRDEPERPVAEVLATLEDLRDSGVIRHYAASNWTAPRLREALELAAAEGYSGFAAHQPEWSLARRNPGTSSGDLYFADAATIAVQKEFALPLVPYSSQAKGYFDKILGEPTDHPAFKFYDNADSRRVGAALRDVGERKGLTPTQTLLAYCRTMEPQTIPVVGCYSIEQLRQSWKSLDVSLDPADVAAIEAARTPR